MGESGGQYGLVPSNMISEVDDPMVSAQFLQDSLLQQGNQTAGKPITPPVHQRHQKQGFNFYLLFLTHRRTTEGH